MGQSSLWRRRWASSSSRLTARACAAARRLVDASQPGFRRDGTVRHLQQAMTVQIDVAHARDVRSAFGRYRTSRQVAAGCEAPVFATVK